VSDDTHNQIDPLAPPPSARSRAASVALGDTQPGEEPTTNWLALLGLLAFFGWLLFVAGPVYFAVAVGVIVMIFLHELGHFMTAKWTGMKPTDFFIGFGPTIVSWKRDEVTYGIKAIPAGAFVRIIGMNNLDPVAPEDADRAYMNKSYPRRMLVITAGSMMHFAQALIIFVLLSSVIGIGFLHPDYDSSGWVVEEVAASDDGSRSTGQELGLVPGDRIRSVDGDATGQWLELLDAVRSRPGESVEFVIDRDGQIITETATIGTVGEGSSSVGRIGVAADFSAVPELQRPGVVAGVEEFGQSMWTAITAIPRFLSPSTFASLAESVISGDSASEQDVDRPVSVVGAVGVAGRTAGTDWTFPIYLLGIINCFVGVLNLLPLLPLDGGHAAIATYERIRSSGGRRHHVDVAKLLPITYAVVGVLAFIGITTIWLDVVLLAS
jgi:membrane-associated protease RseP (regulator of RpoE activity)